MSPASSRNSLSMNNDTDQIHTASGADMNINHISHAIVHAPGHNLDLMSHKHTKIWSLFIILPLKILPFLSFILTLSFIKDKHTRRILLEGRCEGGLYPLPALGGQVLSAIKASSTRWHHRLGNFAFPIVERIISSNKLHCTSESHRESVCDACQQAKGHQLPYPKSTSVTHFPLELVFSDVWGPALDSVWREILC